MGFKESSPKKEVYNSEQPHKTKAKQAQIKNITMHMWIQEKQVQSKPKLIQGKKKYKEKDRN